MTRETLIHRERSALLAAYEAATEFIHDRNKGDFQLPELAGYDADALEQKLCEASQVIIRDMPPYVPAVHALCPTKPAPAPHPAQNAEVERAPVAEAGQADFMLVLQAHAERLNYLLKNPEPGLSTWAQFFGQEVQWFSDYWAGKFANT